MVSPPGSDIVVVVHRPQIHHRHSCFRRQLKTFCIFAGIPLAFTHIVLGHWSTVGGSIDSVLYCIDIVLSAAQMLLDLQVNT